MGELYIAVHALLVQQVSFVFLLRIFRILDDFTVILLECHVNIYNEGHHRHEYAPILHAAKVNVEPEHVGQELVDHAEVAKHLKLARLLILECEELKGVRKDDAQAHAQKHEPVRPCENAWPVREALVQDQHCGTHEDDLNYIHMCGKSLGRELSHLSQCDGAHANKDWCQQQGEEGEVVVVRILVAILLVVAQCHQE